MTVDYVDFLIEKMYSPAAICQKLRMCYEINKDSIYVLHEGRDDRPFYGQMLKRIRAKIDFTFLSCGNRVGVVKAHDYINPLGEFSPKRIMYIVDRDYDEILQNGRMLPKRVFVTDYYSVESYFIGRNCMEGILRNVIGIPREGGILERLLDEMEQTIESFENSMRAMTATILAYKSKGGVIEQDRISVHGCFSFTRDCVGMRVLGARATILRTLGLTVSFSEWRKWYSILRSHDARHWVRGKLFLWLLRNLFARAAVTARRLIDPDRRQYSFSPAPLQGQGIYLFAGQYADVPQSLIKYVRRIRAQRIKK